MVASSLAQELSRRVTRGRLLTAPAQLAGYDTDALGYKTFRPDAVVIPADAEELTAVLKATAQLNVPVTMRGAGTSLSGGPVAAQGGVVIHTSSLRKVRQISTDGFWCEVECSVALNSLDTTLAPYGLFYPPDPSSGPVCTLGGNVAMNAGGAHCFRYGVTSNYVLGVEAVLLDGSVHRFGGPAGGRGSWREDWKRLMVGSEGTLAAFTRFWLRLLPRPEKCWTYRATFANLKSAEAAIQKLALHAAFPVAIELMDPRCVAMVENSPMAVGLPRDAFLIVTEIDGPAVLVDARAKAVADVLNSSGAMDVQYSDDDGVRRGLWKARKVAGGLMGQISPDFLVQDAVIPKRALAEVLQLVYDEADAAGLPAVNVFHAGDGNLHPNFLFDSGKPGEIEKVEAISKRLMQRVVEVGGTLSGEHGIGNDKTAYMPMVFGPDTLRLQLAVPKIFNPHHQLNPLKVFSNRRFEGSVHGRAYGGSESDNHHSNNHHVSPSSKSGTGLPLLPHYFDEVDGTCCVPATTTGSELRTVYAPYAFRFPLLLNEHTSLAEQVASTGFSPASSRFGPWCDNIMGMNWRLPEGRIVRIGERVVKSTTGYDLFRFLLHTDGQFGTPVDFALRLRPDCGVTQAFVADGVMSRIQETVQEILGVSWMHWLDSIDVLPSPGFRQGRLRVNFNCPAEECAVYESWLNQVCGRHQLTVLKNLAGVSIHDGLPDFVVKTSPESVFELAGRLSAEHYSLVILAYNGVIHGYQTGGRRPAECSSQIVRILQPFESQIHASGGDWSSRHVVRPEAAGREADWLGILMDEFRKS